MALFNEYAEMLNPGQIQTSKVLTSFDNLEGTTRNA